MNTNPIKPGINTSELKVLVGSSLGVILLALGIVKSTSDADILTQLFATAIVGGSAMLTLGWLAVKFMETRQDVHALMIQKGLIPTDTTPAVTSETPAEPAVA